MHYLCNRPVVQNVARAVGVPALASLRPRIDNVYVVLVLHSQRQISDEFAPRHFNAQFSALCQSRCMRLLLQLHTMLTNAVLYVFCEFGNPNLAGSRRGASSFSPILSLL